MQRFKKITSGLFLLTVTGFAPIVPEDMVLQYSYEVPCSIFSNGPVYSRSTGLEEYKPESCSDITSIAYVSVFFDSKGNEVYKEIDQQGYRKMGEKDGFKNNPKTVDFVSILEVMTQKVEAAIAYDSTGGTMNSGTGTSYTIAYTVGSGDDRLLAIAIETFSTSQTVTTVTYNGDSATQIDRQSSGAAGASMELWYLTAPATGSNNIVVNWSPSNSIQLRVSSYSGVKQSGQPDASTKKEEPTAANTTVTLTTIADNSWTVIGTGNSSCGTAMTAGAGTTMRSSHSCSSIMDSNAAKTPAGSTSLVVNAGSGTTVFYSVMASFAPAVPAPAVDQSYTLFFE